MALAGGVCLRTTNEFYQTANEAGMLSPEGKCYSFDARANGFVPGEGVGVVVLKRLADALYRTRPNSAHGLSLSSQDPNLSRASIKLLRGLRKAHSQE